MIKVFDISNEMFRDINSENYTDDSVFVFFERAAISVIECYYIICGYFFFNKEICTIFPIDVQKKTIVLSEVAFNNMPIECKKKIEKYNIPICPKPILSNHYINLWFIKDKNPKINDDFTCFCNKILNDISLTNRFLHLNESLYYPISVSEIYKFAKIMYNFTSFDYINKDYEIKFKYIIDALIHGYHINFNDIDIDKYAYNISQLACKKLEEYNV